ncbi:DGAT1/2-independent enzyme synthesizing storage lipids-like [Pogona vitticeps]
MATIKLQRDYSTTCILILAYLWDIFGRIWHGYEIHGIENLPEGPGLLIYYHAALPLDYIFFLSRLFLQKKIHCRTVVDRFAFKLPGLKRLLLQLLMMTGTKDDCLSVLKEGHLLAISPGGTREALFSDETYKILWGKRTGFAQLAIDAKVPIIPMFTQNVREGYRTLGKIKMLEKLYEYVRWPVVLFYGGLPVKWQTYLGDPIPYVPGITAEDLAQKTKAALQNLIDKHQKRPGSMGEALLERFHSHRKND